MELYKTDYKPLNILFLFYAPMVPFIGGIQRVTENLAVEFKKRGHNVYYFNTNVNESDFGYKSSVQSFNTNYPADPEKAIADYTDVLQKYKIDIVINQEVREDLLHILSNTPSGIKRITCIHIQPFYCQTYYRELIKGYNLPGVKAKIYKTFCTLFPFYFYNQTLNIYRKSVNSALKTSDYLCLLSDKFLPRIKKYMPEVDESKFIAVNNPNTFSSTPMQSYNKKKQILWVGRHENTPKNFPLFVDVWVKLSMLHPDWEAIVLGDGKDWEYNKQYACKKNATNISFLGNQKDVAKFYKDASFIIVTSYYEGWGLILTEAMNYGCIPCTFDTYESVHEIIDNRINGLIISPFDVEMMACEIDTLINNLNQMNEIRTNCYTKVSKFSVEKIVDEWELILKTIYDEKI